MTDLPPDITEDDLAPHPSDDDYDWDQALAGIFGGASAVDDEPDGGLDDDPTPSGDEDVAGVDGEPPVDPGDALDDDGEPEPEVTLPESFDLGNGVIVSRDELSQLAGIRDWFTENPDQVRDFMGYLTGETTLVPRGQQPAGQPEPQQQQPEPALPPLDEDELQYLPSTIRERLKALDTLAEQNRALIERQQQHEQFLAYQAEQQRAQQIASTYQQAVSTGLAAWRERHPNVSDEDLVKVRKEAADLGVASAIAQRTGDPVQGVVESLEIAWLRNPEFRERELQGLQEQAAAEAQRRRKQDAIASNAGSTAPRTTAAPSTPEERFEAMVDAIRAAQSG